MIRKEVKRTPAERIRKGRFEAYFNKQCEAMEQRGYQKHDLTGGLHSGVLNLAAALCGLLRLH